MSVVSWRYTETGDFVDFDGFIFTDRFVGSGTSAGPLILGGVRIPVGAIDIGGEIRHQLGEGKLDPLDFAGATKVDLGGFSYLGAAVQGKVSGALVQAGTTMVAGHRHYDFGPAILFWIGASVVSLVLATALWRVRPSD